MQLITNYFSNASSKITVEAAHGLISQVLKNYLFNKSTIAA